jgi:hypothetical protein
MLEQLGIEILKRVLKRIRLGTGEVALHNGQDCTRCGEMGQQELHGVSETSGVVAGETPDKGDGRSSILRSLFWVLVDRKLDLILALELRNKIVSKFGGLEELDELGAAAQHKLVLVRHHTQKLVDAVRNLPLRTSDGNLIACLLGAGEADLAVVLLFQLVNLWEPGNQFAVVQSINIHDL